jgi:hypothetical protein
VGNVIEERVKSTLTCGGGSRCMHFNVQSLLDLRCGAILLKLRSQRHGAEYIHQSSGHRCQILPIQPMEDIGFETGRILDLDVP